MLKSFWQALTRRKRNDGSSGESQLARVLNLFDLTALGVGSTLGLGVYILAGSVAREMAGPAVVLSFLFAAIASAFAGLCYAEFASRVPRAGSAYVYSYVTVGEFVAFTIGWNLILEYVIGTSSVARALSGYIDALCGRQLQHFYRHWMPMDVSFLAEYPDWLAFFLVMLLAVLLSAGVKKSSILNNIFTTANMATICIIIVAGAIKSDPANWRIPKEQIPEGVHGGEGGFMPFGLVGVMAGAAKCFYGFVGFDCVATTGEEAKNPKRNIPMSILISLFVVFLSYFGVSLVLTMMWPYYLQDPESPFPHVFEEIGWIKLKWIVTIGAIFSLCTALLGSMFPLPRVIYAMADDGVLYPYLKRIHPRVQTPVVATMVGGLLAAAMALIFTVDQLVDMMSIGTLIAYTIVAISVLVLHYQCDAEAEALKIRATHGQVWQQLLNLNGLARPNRLSTTITKFGVALFIVCTVMLCIAVDYLEQNNFDNVVLGTLYVAVTVMLVIMLIILRQPKSEDRPTFQVPFVPFIPCLSIVMNLYLMFQLNMYTWIRLGVWAIFGYFIYFTHGIRHSSEGALRFQEKLEAKLTKEAPSASTGQINQAFEIKEEKIIQAPKGAPSASTGQTNQAFEKPGEKIIQAPKGVPSESAGQINQAFEKPGKKIIQALSYRKINED